MKAEWKISLRTSRQRNKSREGDRETMKAQRWKERMDNRERGKGRGRRERRCLKTQAETDNKSGLRERKIKRR